MANVQGLYFVQFLHFCHSNINQEHDHSYHSAWFQCDTSILLPLQQVCAGSVISWFLKGNCWGIVLCRQPLPLSIWHNIAANIALGFNKTQTYCYRYEMRTHGEEKGYFICLSAIWCCRCFFF